MTCEELDERIRAWQMYREKPDWLEGQRGLEPCIAAALDANRASGDWLTFSKYVVAALRHPSAAYSETLCAVLDERRDDVNSEDIIEAIEDGRDPAAIPSLRRAVTWYDESDEFGQLQRKAVLALGHIGTPEALAAIRETVTPDMPEKVVEAAQQVLARG